MSSSYLSNSKSADQIQDEIYYDMSSEKKIRLTSQFFMLGRKLKESKTVLKNESRRSTSKNS
jgi:hypothetical protein